MLESFKCLGEPILSTLLKRRLSKAETDLQGEGHTTALRSGQELHADISLQKENGIISVAHASRSSSTWQKVN